MFKKHTEEIKKEVDDLINNGRVLSIGILAVTCLTVGYIIGSVTTASIYRTVALSR